MGEVFKRSKGGRFLGYSLRYYEGGRRRVLASKQPSYAEARRMLLEIEARIARGQAGVPAPVAPAPTVAELAERFLSEYRRPKIKDITRYRENARVALKRVLPRLGRLRCDAVSATDISKTRDELRVSAASVRLSLAFLGTMFSWAVSEKLIPQNPIKGVERPRVEPSIDFLTKEEACRLLHGAAERAAQGTLADRLLHACIFMALYTGLRKGELFGLRWTDLDLETRRLTVARSYGSTPKSNKPRHLRLPAVVVPVLREWRSDCPHDCENSVFPSGLHPRGGARQLMLGLPELMAALGLRKVPHPWHLLRHSFASHYVMAGGNILALQRILGHSDVKMTMIYAHLQPDFLDGEMDRVRF